MEYYLYHSGIKGMKWGIRRYQKKDGSLTPLGRLHYKRLEKKAARKARKDVKDAESIEEKKARILKSRSAKELYENADLFTTQELRTAYDRLQLERNISSLVPKEISKGEKFVSKSIDWGKKTSDILETGSRLYNNIAKVHNAFNDKNDPLPIIGDKSKDKNNNKNNKDDDE